MERSRQREQPHRRGARSPTPASGVYQSNTALRRRRGSLASQELLARYARRYEDRHPWLFRDFLSVQHPDFGLLEYHFRNEEVFRNAKVPPKGFSQRKMQDLLDEGNVEAAQLINCPALDAEDLEEPRPAVPPELPQLLGRLQREGKNEDIVFKTLARLGLRALWEGGFAPLALEHGQMSEEGNRILSEIRRQVRRRLAEWYGWARSRDFNRRTLGAQRLRRLGSCLAGDRRGKRCSALLAPPSFVRDRYYRLLYRLVRAMLLLPRCRSVAKGRSATIEFVAAACGLGEARLTQYLCLDCDGRPKSRPLPPEQAVRVWVAQEFGLKDKTVRNLLASWPKLKRKTLI